MALERMDVMKHCDLVRGDPVHALLKSNAFWRSLGPASLLWDNISQDVETSTRPPVCTSGEGKAHLDAGGSRNTQLDSGNSGSGRCLSKGGPARPPQLLQSTALLGGTSEHYTRPVTNPEPH